MLRSIYLLTVLVALGATAASGQSLEERCWGALNEGRDLSRMHSVVEMLAGPGRRVPSKPEIRANALRLLDRIEDTAALGELAVDSDGVAASVGEDWPSMGGNAAHTGKTTQPGPTLGKLVWQHPVGWPWKAAVSEQRVYPGAVDGILYALNRSSGVLMWQHNCGDWIRSQTAAREAVGRLAAIGLLEGRKRKGLVVRRPDPLRLLELGLPALFDLQQDIFELAMLRYVLEMGTVEPAVRNGTDDQVRLLCELADKMEEAIHNGTSERVAETDIAFHSALLEMTGFTLAAGMQRVLVRFFSSREAVPCAATDNRGIRGTPGTRGSYSRP